MNPSRSISYHFVTNEFDHYYTHELTPRLSVENDDDLPEWTRLEYKQCEGCRWNASSHCPVAVALIEPSKLLGKLVSFDAVHVTVTSPERTYSKSCTAQEALSALFGLVMATSGCPSFDFLRGLAWFHLPFASYEETLFRAISVHLLRHYLDQPNAPLSNINAEVQRLYDQLHLTNLGISKRLRHGVAPATDSPMNAIIILDSMGSMVPMSAEAGLKDLRRIFL